MSSEVPPDNQSSETAITPAAVQPVPGTPTQTHVVEHEGGFKNVYLIGVVALLMVAVAAFLLFRGDTPQRGEVRQFANVYSFVPEKISKSAPIQITLPAGIDELEAQESISFDPPVPGGWQADENPRTLTYMPSAPLEVGKYYAVHLEAETAQMSGDFLVDEDPQIEALFPAANTESHEDTEITIIFNRPMVPLTTLQDTEEIDLPITITPETPGRFKWISTRNLQFIPETTLIPSSEYEVVIDSGLYSVDGLPVAPTTHRFITRPLRYTSLTSDEISYRSPAAVRFNQAVDIDSTKDRITVRKDGREIGVRVTYGERTFWDEAERKFTTEEDPNVLHIYQRKDQHGREDLWDFESSYEIEISGARPLFGTKSLAESRTSVFSVPNIVRSVTVASDKTRYADVDMVDPEGTVTIAFHDDVSIDDSRIEGKGIESITYAQRCRTDEAGNTITAGNSCEKEDDPRTLIFDLRDTAYSIGEQFSIALNRIKTPDGFKINNDPIVIDLRIYPELQVYRTVPDNGNQSADVSGMTVCTNIPLRAPEESLSEYISTDGYIVYGRWAQSFKVSARSSRYVCNEGEFQTKLHYGLLPETDYALGLSLTGAFGQMVSNTIALRTEVATDRYTRFHNMQKTFNVTTPSRTKLTYAVENLESINMHICKLPAETFLERSINRDGRFEPPVSAGCSQVLTEEILLPARYWVSNYFQVNLADRFADTKGHYVITFSHPLYQGEQYNRDTRSREKKPLYERTYVSVTDLAVTKKEVVRTDNPYSQSDNPRADAVRTETLNASRNLYWVNVSESLTPAVGAQVTQYRSASNDTITPAGSASTDGAGVARVTVAEEVVGAIVSYNGQHAVVADWSDTLRGAGQTRDASRTYVYTDRPIYRPGQTVHIKGIDRIGFDGSYEVWNSEPVPLFIKDARGATLYETTLEQTEYGTFGTSFELPQDTALGTYRIEVFGQTSWFDVEEYVPAAFKLEVGSNEDEFTDGDTMEVGVQADYYFGVPVDGGTVAYSVTAQDYYFDRYTDEYFNFGRGWYYCYDCGYGDDFLFGGSTEIDEHGRATIKRQIDFDTYFAGEESVGSKLFTFTITAKDLAGRSVSAQQSFVVHKGEFYLGVKTDRYYTGVNQPLNVRIKTVDTTGQPRAVKNIEKTVNKVEWETFRRQEVDGGYYYRSEKKQTPISTDTIRTDDDGNWSEELSLTAEGQYEVVFTATDERGNVISTTRSLYIHGSRSVSVPPNNNYELDLEADNTELSVGDTGSLLIKSPYERGKVLITAERGTIEDYWIADVQGGLHLHEFSIKEAYAPNIYLSATLLTPEPEVKYGSIRYNIGTEQKELTVDVQTNKEAYLPGESVTLTVKTTDHTGRGVPAEVSLAIADLSVLALKGNPKKDPTVFFYDGFPLSVTTASNIKNILYEMDIPLGSKGGGGAAAEDLATKKRGVFKDTAYWEASVETSATGDATVTFTLPDNLTTWQVESLGVTKDTKLGVDYEEFTTRKELMATPLKPRFVVPGDTFSLGAKVYNQTTSGETITVEITSDTLDIHSDSTDEIFLNSGESKTIYFTVSAPREMDYGTHSFIFAARGDGLADIVEQTISITPNETYETTATANFTDADQAQEYLFIPDEVLAGKGGLTINANATLAVFMEDSLDYMLRYPYGCSEQIASSLSSIAILMQALALPNVEGEAPRIEREGVEYDIDTVITEGLNRVYEAQVLNGGFAYYKGLSANLSLTLHVVTALAELREAGYDIREDVLTRAAQYVEGEARKESLRNKDMVIFSEYTLRRLNNNQPTVLSAQVGEYIADTAFINERSSNLSLAYLALVTTGTGYSERERENVYQALTNRIDIDGRGAHLERKSAAAGYYETPIKNTALLLKVFAAHEDEHVTTGNVLRWLLASRDKRGAWGSTHNTFVVVDAMVDYLRWQRETESDFSLRGWLGELELFTFDFNPTTIFETFTHFVGIDDMERETLIPLRFERENRTELESNFYYDMALQYYLPVESLPPRDEGITVSRGLYTLDDTQELEPVYSAEVGEVLKGKLTITTPAPYTDVAIEDYIPAGFELVNFNLATEDQSLRDERAYFKTDDSVLSQESISSTAATIRSWFGATQAAQVFRGRTLGGSYRDGGRTLYPTHSETHDDRVFLFVERLQPGVHEYEYYIRALVPGEFQRLPARAEQLYLPEVFGRTVGDIITVSEAQ